MTQGGFLDADDLRLLTGAARANGQEAWLRQRGVPCRREGSRVIVLWTHVTAWLEGRTAPTGSGINWNAPHLSNA